MSTTSAPSRHPAGRVDRRGPRPPWNSGDGGPNVVGDREPDRVLQPLFGEVIAEGVGEPGTVGADQDPLGPVSVGQLRQGGVEDGDVVGGGVRPGVARAQDPAQRLVGVVQKGEQRVVSVAALEVPGRLFLLRVHLDQGGVQIDHHVIQVLPGRPSRWQLPSGDLAAGQPGPIPHRRPGQPQTRQPPSVDRVQDPPGRGRRGDRAVQTGLIGERGDVPGIASPPSASITARSTST